MSSIDERIVEMQFDNNEFEKNINESIQSLEKLKKSLKIEESGDAFRNIQNASKDVNFDHISEGLDALNKRFSTTGIIGMQVIQSLTQEAIRLGGQLINAVTAPVRNDVIQGGWQRALNIQQAKFQLEGLGADVEAVMIDVDNAVSGTAYGLDEAALVASQLAASGIEAGEGVGQMGQALLAVSGMAAMTGRSYGEIGHIMTTIAGNGRLMGMQLTQLSTYGLNVAAELGKQLGYTEQEIRDMVSKGMIDFNTFATAMYDAYHEHAKNANKTLMGSISNVHAALKKIGQDFMNPLVENDGSLVHLVNTIRLAINEIRKLTRPFAENTWTPWIKGVLDGMDEMLNKFAFFRDTRPIEYFYNRLESVGVSAKDFRKMLFEVARDIEKVDVLQPFATYEEFIDHYGNFRESLKEGWLTSDVIQSAIAALNGETGELAENTAELNSEYEKLRDLVASVWRGDWGNGAERIRLMNEAGLDYAKIQSLVNKCEKGRELTLEDLDEEMLESIGVTKDQAKTYVELKKKAEEANIPIEYLLEQLYRPTMLQMVGTTIGNIIGGIIDFLHVLRDAISEVFGGATYEGLYDFMYAIYQASFNFRMWNNETEEFTARGQGLKSIFKALFIVVKIVAKFIGGLVTIGFKLIQVLWPIGDAIIVVIGAIAQFAGDILSFVDSLGLMETIFTGLGYVISPVVDGFTALSNTVTNAFAERLKKISDFFNEVKEALNGNTKVSENALKFAEALTKIKEIFDNLMQTAGRVITAATDAITRFFESFKMHPEVQRFISNLERIWGLLKENLSGKLEKVGESLQKVFGKDFEFSLEGFANFLGNLLKPLNDLLENVNQGSFDKLGEAGKGFIGFLQDAIKFVEDLAKKLFKLGDESIGNFFKNFDWGNAIDAASALSIVYMVFKIGTTINRLPSGVFFQSLKTGIYDVSRLLKSFRWKLLSGAFMEAAIAISVVAGAIYILGNMDEETLNKGTHTVVLIVALLVILTILLTRIKKIDSYFQYITGQSKNYASLAKAFLMFGAAIAAIVWAMSVIKDMDLGQLVKSGITVGLIIVALTAAFIALEKFNVGRLARGCSSMIAMAAAIDLIAVALLVLSIANPGKLIAAGITVMLVSSVMSTMLYFLADKEPSKMLAAAGSLTIAAVALGIMAAAIGALSITAITGKTAHAVIALMAIVGTIAVALGVLSSEKFSGKKMVAAAGSFVIMAAAINLMIPALLALIGIAAVADFWTIAGAFTMLAATLTAFIVAGYFASSSNVAPGLMALSMSLLAFGAGAYFAAKALLVLGLALPTFIAGLAVMGTILYEKWPEILLAITAIIAAVCLAISGSFPAIMGAIQTIIKALGAGFVGALPVLTKFLYVGMVVLGAFVLDMLPVVVEFLINALIGVINALSVAMVEHGNELLAAIGNVLKAILYLVWTAILELIDMCLGWIPGVHEGIEHAMADSETFFKENWMSDLDFEHKGGEEGKKWAKGFFGSAFDEAEKNGKIAGGFGAMPGYADEIRGKETSSPYKQSKTGFDPRNIEPWPPKETVEESRKNANELYEIEQGAVENHKRSAAEMKKTNEENANSSDGGLFSFFKVTDEQKGWIEEAKQKYGEAGKEPVKAYTEGQKTAIEENKENLDPYKAIVEQVLGSDSSAEVDAAMDQKASGTISSYTNSLINHAGEVDIESILSSQFIGENGGLAFPAFENAGEVDATAWLDSFTNTSKTKIEPEIEAKSNDWPKKAENTKAWNAVGSNNIVGLINGMLSKNGEVTSAARRIAQNAIDAAKNTLGQESPSKVFHQMGVYNDKGLINGMLSLSGKVEDASETVADSAINGAQYAMARIQSIINSDMDLSPTIRPVFDDSLIQNGINAMSIWGNGYALNLAGSVGSVNISQGQIFEDLNKRLDSRFKELSDRMDKLGDQTFDFNLTTTLDGREIARGTATYTSEELNRITRNNNRKAGKRG